MKASRFEDIREKLDFTRSGKPMLIGMAIILVLVAGSAGLVLSSTATASKFEVQSGDKELVQEEGREETVVVVHVSGAVGKPGVYKVGEGSRVADAVEAAGGFTDDADQDACNLARVVEDGEHIAVPVEGAEEQFPEQAQASTSPSNHFNQGRLNVNLATAEELKALPGIGAATASKIVADRDANGTYKTVDDLKRVSGIGDKKLAEIASLVCV